MDKTQAINALKDYIADARKIGTGTMADTKARAERALDALNRLAESPEVNTRTQKRKTLTDDQFTDRAHEWAKIAEREANRRGLEFLDHGHQGTPQTPSYKVSVRANVK